MPLLLTGSKEASEAYLDGAGPLCKAIQQAIKAVPGVKPCVLVQLSFIWLQTFQNTGQSKVPQPCARTIALEILQPQLKEDED